MKKENLLKLRKIAAYELLAILDGLNKFLILRDLSGIESGCYRDIDLLTLDDDFQIRNVVNSLKQSGIKILRFVSRYKYFQIICYKENWKESIILDIWDGLRIKGSLYFNKEDLIINDFHEFKKIKTTTYRLSNFISITKCLTQAGKIKPKYIKSISEEEYRIISNSLIGDNFLYLKGKSKIVINLLLFFKYIFRKEYYFWLLSVVRFSFRKKTLIIYLLGPDGSGKSTLSSFLLNNTNLRTKFKYVHGGIKFLPRLSDLLSLLFKKTKRKEDKSTPEKAINSSHNNVNGRYTIFHLFYYSLDSIFVNINSRFSYSKDICLVADRCNYDILARDYYTSLPRKWRWIIVKLTLRPDYCFILKGDARKINKRKPELSVKEINKQYKNYELLKKYINTIEIPANNFEETIKAITSHLEITS